MTGTVLRKLATSKPSVSTPGSVQDLSYAEMESQLITYVAEFESVSRAIDAVGVLSNSFSSTKNISSEQAQQYELSVESVFKAIGWDIPASVLVPSFESTEDYSTEAESKAVGVLQRAGAWLMEQLRKIGELIMELINNFKQSVGRGKQRLTALGERISALKNKKSEVSTESAQGGIQVADTNLIGGGGSKAIAAVKTAQDNTRKAGTDTLDILRRTMEIFKGFQPGSHDASSGSEEIIQRLVSQLDLKKVDKGYVRELPIGPGNSVLIELTQSNNRTSAKVSHHQAPKSPGKVPGMTGPECELMLKTLVSFYDNFESMKSPMDAAAKVFKQMADRMNTSFKEQMAKINKGANAEEAKVASQASQMYAMFATILSQLGRLPRENLSTYMLTQWAMEKYLDLCVDALEGKKAA